MFTSPGWTAAADGAARPDPSPTPARAQGASRSIGLVVVHGVGRQRPGETSTLLVRSLLAAPPFAAASGRLIGRRLAEGGGGRGADQALTLAARAARGELRVRIYEAYWGDLATRYTPWDLVRYRLWLLGTLTFPIVNLLRRRYRPQPIPLVAFLRSYAALAATGIAAHLSDLALRVALRALALRGTERKVNRVILEYAGDVYRFVGAAGLERRRILERVAEPVARAAAENDEVQIAGHSLGSALAFDALTAGLLTTQEAVKLRALHTWGSPLDKIYFVWPARLGFALDPLPARPLRWLNWHHRRDPIGGSLDFFDSVAGLAAPENHVYSAPGPLASAHVDYWTRSEVVASLLHALGVAAD